ncbi:AAA family ATPase [Streptomyces sp. NPDC091271]|uniref:AAA family ATPase n=1 Tax=Streptomyces sp. NPDC091271 TaxID=3365980 RepID=UPI00382C0D92
MTMISTVAVAVDTRSREGFALVALDGMGGSGKSTMAEALAELHGAVVVHGDDFYHPMNAEERARLNPVQGYHRYFDWQRFRDEVLAPLAAGRDAAYRRYDWETGTLAPDETHTRLPLRHRRRRGGVHRPARTR